MHVLKNQTHSQCFHSFSLSFHTINSEWLTQYLKFTLERKRKMWSFTCWGSYREREGRAPTSHSSSGCWWGPESHFPCLYNHMALAVCLESMFSIRVSAFRPQLMESVGSSYSRLINLEDKGCDAVCNTLMGRLHPFAKAGSDFVRASLYFCNKDWMTNAALQGLSVHPPARRYPAAPDICKKGCAR